MIGEPIVGWDPPPPIVPTVLEGRAVAVAPLTRAAADSLWVAFADDEASTWQYMPYGPFAGPGELAALVGQWAGSVDPLFFTFDVQGAPQGWGAYLRMVPGDGVAEVGHLAFGPALRRTTAATEAMYLMMRHVFELGYRRYEWKCDALNEASRSAATRLGFTYEGTFRQHTIYKGRNRDTAWYSILDSEWPAARDRLEAWLDPANFDESGEQRSRLQP